jgi:uncharacterized protein YjbJ (UPF0337 family)
MPIEPESAVQRNKNMNEDEITGAGRDAVGKVKDAAGGLTGETGMQADGKLDQAAGKVQGKFGEAKEQLGDTAGTVADKASEFADREGAATQDAAQMARRGAGQASETVYDAGARAGQYVGRTLQDQPLLSLIGVAAIGYAIGFLIHSPMSPLVSKPKTRRYLR